MDCFFQALVDLLINLTLQIRSTPCQSQAQVQTKNYTPRRKRTIAPNIILLVQSKYMGTMMETLLDYAGR
jgi:hypothetical protein